MERQKEALKLAEEILTDIELERCGGEQCLLKAQRLARLTGNSKWDKFLKAELFGYSDSKELRPYANMVGRLVGGSQVYWHSLATLEAHRKSHQDKLASMSSMNVSGDWANVVSQRQLADANATAKLIATYAAIISRVKAVLYDIASTVYFELKFSESQASLFEISRREIDARLAPLSKSALEKMDSVIDRLNAGNVEAISQAMNTCRRLIDDLADSLFPPQEAVTVDGNQIKLGAQNHLNRLNAYVAERVESKGRRDRIRRSLGDIYGRVSSGVHSDISLEEARFLFLLTYATLGEIIMLPDATS